ncbi:reverse transcriptase domain-containing protein, partial [Tanacetum coccineum]
EIVSLDEEYEFTSFQDDAKYDHVGQDTRSQDGKDDKDKQGKDLKISELKTKSKDNDKGSRSKITKLNDPEKVYKMTLHQSAVTNLAIPEGNLILNKTEASGKLAKYVVELGAYNITFEPRNAVKGQVWADFISETSGGEPTESYFQTPKIGLERDNTERWTLFTNGASNLKGSEAGLVLTGPSGVEYTYALRLTYTSTNNKAEYESLLAGLRIARKMMIQSLEAKVDSKLIASQINGNYMATNDNMIKYLAKAKE